MCVLAHFWGLLQVIYVQLFYQPILTKQCISHLNDMVTNQSWFSILARKVDYMQNNAKVTTGVIRC